VGFGRTGSFFAMDQVGVVPDMMCVAKGLSGGYLPLAATLTTEAVYSAFLGAAGSNRQLFHGHTYTGNPLACAAAIATLEVFEEERTLEKARNLAKHLGILLRTRIKPLPWVKAIRQKGVMVGIDIARDDGEPFHPQLLTGHRVAMAARPHGAIVRPLGDTLVINPPLALPEEGLHALIRAVDIGFHDALGSL
jgi:adenosylmethionine-8-amino-7-oxononanoate aminotransferase